MKFILHNLRMIWSRFRSNGWVLAELFLVFVVMWFLCDSLGCLKYTFYRPLEIGRASCRERVFVHV